MSVFDFIRFATKAGVVLQDAAAVDWAVWLHDVVYDPRRCVVSCWCLLVLCVYEHQRLYVSACVGGC